MADSATADEVYLGDESETGGGSCPVGADAPVCRVVCSVEDAALEDLALMLHRAAVSTGARPEELLAAIPDSALAALYRSSAKKICRMRLTSSAPCLPG